MENIVNMIGEAITDRELISPERFINAAFALILALIVGFITGPRAYSAVPLFWRLIDISFGALADRLDNVKRKSGDLLLRGFFISIFMILFTGAVGVWFDETLYLLPQERIFEILIISLCISVGAILHHGMRLHQVMKGAKISDGTYLVLARTSRIDLSGRDDPTLTRTGAEIVVRLYDKACIAPLIWYVLGGLPLLFVYSGLAALSWKKGYDGTYNNVGKMVLMLEKLLGFIPSIFAASLLAASTIIVPFSNPLSGLKSLTSEKKQPYEQGGLVLTTLCNTLNIALGGAVTTLNGRNMKREWAGPKGATAQLGADHLKRVLYMVFVGYILMIAALLSGSMWANL